MALVLAFTESVRFDCMLVRPQWHTPSQLSCLGSQWQPVDQGERCCGPADAALPMVHHRACPAAAHDGLLVWLHALSL
jgi:hypothetical protein